MNAQRTWSELCGRTFHSAGEARYGEFLLARQMHDEIRDLSFQARVQLVRGMTMLPDFSYIELVMSEFVPRPQRVWHEFKGFETPAWKRNRNVWAAGLGPGLLLVTYPRSSRSMPYHTVCITPDGFDPNDNPNIIEDNPDD